MTDTYRGWRIDFIYPPIPLRQFDWQASHPDYDGAEDGSDHRIVHGQTRDAVCREIDLWHLDNEEAMPSIVSYTEWNTSRFAGAIVAVRGAPLMRDEDFALDGTICVDMVHRGEVIDVTIASLTGTEPLDENAVRDAVLKAAEKSA